MQVSEMGDGVWGGASEMGGEVWAQLQVLSVHTSHIQYEQACIHIHTLHIHTQTHIKGSCLGVPTNVSQVPMNHRKTGE